jgi:copper transport protein
VILILAAFARRWVQRHCGPSAARPDAPSLRTMRLSVGAEAALGAVVLALTATLVGTVPARQSYGPPFAATVHGKGVDGTPVVMYVDIGPTRVGTQTVYLSTHNSDGYVIPFATAALTLTQPDGAPLRFPLSQDTAPGYATGQVVVPRSGHWSVTVEMTTPDDRAFAGTTGYDVN